MAALHARVGLLEMTNHEFLGQRAPQGADDLRGRHDGDGRLGREDGGDQARREDPTLSINLTDICGFRYGSAPVLVLDLINVLDSVKGRV